MKERGQGVWCGGHVAHHQDDRDDEGGDEEGDGLGDPQDDDQSQEAEDHAGAHRGTAGGFEHPVVGVPAQHRDEFVAAVGEGHLKRDVAQIGPQGRVVPGGGDGCPDRLRVAHSLGEAGGEADPADPSLQLHRWVCTDLDGGAIHHRLPV